jgi:hypothetical protein
MRAITTIVLVLTAIFGFANNANAERRIALVVGNGSYSNISTLRNTTNDAELMAATLETVGFEVIVTLDADRRELGRAIRDFGTLLRGTGSDTIGLFYYAGHGVQYNGQNYIIPLNAEIEFAADLNIEAFRVEDVLQQMALSGNAFNMAILDACRNNPFPAATRATERGLARVTTYNSALVAFAAAPGQVAQDGDGANSPYTSALAEAILTPGLTVEEVFKQTRVAVLTETGGVQTPWEESSLTGRFSFIEETANDDQQNAVVEPSQEVPEATRLEIELAFWNSVKESGNPMLLQAYLDDYPNGVFAVIASLMIAQLSEPDEAHSEIVEPRGPTDEMETETALLGPDVAVTAPAVEPERPDPNLPRNLQAALSAVGCDPGAIDGIWGRGSQRALDSFAQHASISLPEEPISTDTLDLIEGYDDRVCPLVCGRREVERNGTCVTKTCPSGQILNSGGVCVQRTQSAEREQVAPSASDTSPQTQDDEGCGYCRQGGVGPAMLTCGAYYRIAVDLRYCD